MTSWRTILSSTGGLLAAGALAVSLVGGGGRANGQAAAPAVADLRKERVAVLREASALADHRWDIGVTPLAEALECNRLLVEAELESAVTIAARSAVLRPALAAAKAREADVARREQAGTATHLETLEAKAHRLRIEVWAAAASLS